MPLRRNEAGAIISEDLALEILRGVAQAQTEVNLSLLEQKGDNHDFPGRSFLEKINLDRFKTFIRLAANFNVLGEFLKGFEKSKQKELLENFVSGLENTSYVNYEDATDVANSLASIQDKEVKTFLGNSGWLSTYNFFNLNQ